jgi:N-acetylmuramoyl-L-alanine amidase
MNMKTLSTALAAIFFASAAVNAMPTAAPLPVPAERAMTPVILDPGHGGDDLGAVVKGVNEKDIALAVSLKLRDKLKDSLPVRLTRDSDVYVTLDDRVVNAVDWNGAVFVSIHLNQVRSKKLAGATVYSYGAEKRHWWRRKPRHPKVPPMPAPPRVEAKESSLLAAAMTRSLRESGVRVEQAKSDYYVLKNPSLPSVLVELGYLSNPEEAARLADPAYQDKLAASLAKAIAQYASERVLRADATASAAAPAKPL